MKSLQRVFRLFLAVPLMLLGLPGQCLALMSIAEVTKPEARKMGVEVRSSPAGPDAVRVEIEFKAEGALKDFSRAQLEVLDGGKTLLSATLQAERKASGQVLVEFLVDRANLDKISVRIVVQYSPRGMTGYDFSMKHFLGHEADLLGAPASAPAK